MKLPRFARLLPLVVLAIGALLVLNGTGLLRDGVALAQTAASALTDAPQPSNRDFAEPDQQIASANEADIMTSLSRRRGELDARESQVRIQADLMAAAEKRVDAKIAQLQALQTKIAALVAERDEALCGDEARRRRPHLRRPARYRAGAGGAADEIRRAVADHGPDEPGKCQDPDGEAGRPAGPAPDGGCPGARGSCGCPGVPDLDYPAPDRQRGPGRAEKTALTPD
jgi:hypothetical protein